MNADQVSPELQNFIQRESQVAQVQQVIRPHAFQSPVLRSINVLPQMIAGLTSECWDKCQVSSSGNYLSGKETSCLSNCALRFVEATQYIMQRAAKKASGGSMD
jgi:import inner membrane translocase subunit TIM8